MLTLILLILAGLCALAALVGIPSRVSLTAVGLLLVVVALLVPRL